MRVARFVAWLCWQLFVLAMAFIVWANLFSEYGVYTDPRTSNIAAIVFLILAVYLGTLEPLRRWRRRDRQAAAEDR